MFQIDPNEPEEALPIHLSMCHRRHLDSTPPGVKWIHDPRVGGRLINNYFVTCRSFEYYQNGPIYRVTFPDGKERDVMACRVGCCRACAGRAIDVTDNRKQPPYVKPTDMGPQMLPPRITSLRHRPFSLPPLRHSRQARVQTEYFAPCFKEPATQPDKGLHGGSVQQFFDRPGSNEYIQLLCSKGSADGSSPVSVECFVEDHCQECAAKELGPRRPGEQGGPDLPGPST